MTDRTFWKGLALWLSFFAVLALVVGAVFAFGFLSVGRAPAAMDDLHVSNDDDANHTVRIEIVAANDSTVFERTVRLAPDERVSFENATARGRQYRLVVAVDDRESRSFAIEGPDDLCMTEVRVESNAAVDIVTGCA